jgi:hypothetical protein
MTFSAGNAGQAARPSFLAVREQAPVLALLDDDELGAELEDVDGGGDGVDLAREQLGLVVVEHHAIDLAEQLHQLGLGDVDPQVHGVRDREGAPGKSGQELQLHARVRVGQEDDLGVAEPVGDARRRLGQDAQLCEERLAAVHVVVVLAAPREGLGVGRVSRP